MQVCENNTFGFKYASISEGSDDICIVNNYLPYFEYVIKKEDTLLDILSKGYKIQNTRDIVEGDVVIINKPRSIRYVTKPLEKMEDIANKFGLKKEYIMEVNNLSCEKLFVGQILWL